MTETRYLLPTSKFMPGQTGGAIVPAGTASIDRYAQDVYLALPPEKQNQAGWAALQTFADQGDWQSLQTIHNHFTSNSSSSLTISDNSSHAYDLAQNDRHDQYSYDQYSYDNRSSSLAYSDESQIAYTDDRTWTENQYSYADNSALDYYQYSDESQTSYTDYTDDRSWVTHDNRSWVTSSDDRQWVDNGSYSYAPTYAPVHVDNSVYLNVDIYGSFNNNGSGNDSSSHSSSKQVSGGNDEGFDPIKFVLFIFSVGLAAILAAGMWANVRSNGTPSNPYYYSPNQ